MSNRITLVVPYYNRERYLPRTLQSILRSKAKPFELILVDNNSTDGSYAICEAFAKENATDEFRITLLTESQAGAAVARNCGLQECQTEWICFFDSDDELDENFLSDIAQQLNDGLDMIAVPTRIIVNGRSMIRKYCATDNPVAQIFYSHLNTQGMVFRTDFLRQLDGWNEAAMVWNDWELGLRALLAHPRLLWFTPHAYHNIYIHPDGITGNSFAHLGWERLKTLRIIADYVSGYRFSVKVQHVVLRALYLRHAILEGRFRAESQKDLAHLCFKQANSLVPYAPGSLRLYARIIAWLTAKKMPGTWWLAYHLA